jgi:hypothetical protein
MLCVLAQLRAHGMALRRLRVRYSNDEVRLILMLRALNLDARDFIHFLQVRDLAHGAPAIGEVFFM